MMKNFRKRYRSVFAVLLTLCILTGCLAQRRPVAESTNETIEKDYEEYAAASLAAQKKFEKLTKELFLDEVVQSTINLHYTLADPSAYGIESTPITYGDFSFEQIQANIQDMKDLKAALEKIEVKQLKKEQQLTYRILFSYINTELSSEGLELYDQPLAPTIGLQAQLPVLLAEYSFYNKQDIENYLNLLSGIDEYYAQILEFEKQKAEAGLFMSDTSVDHVLESCESYLLLPENNFLVETFQERMETLSELTAEEKSAFQTRNIQILTDDFVPAYQLLIDGLKALKGSGTNENGLCGFPRGKQYYEYLVNSATGTSYPSIDELRDAIQTQMDQDLADISDLVDEQPDLLDSLDHYAFSKTEPDDILKDLQNQITKDFPPLPDCNYMVKYVPKALELSLSPAFYLTPPIDRYQDNVIYINGNEEFSSDDLYTTLAHEGYPGHLYQTVYFTDSCTSDLRKLLSFSSYSEGWDTYVENYSYSLDNGLEKNLGEMLAHNSAATLALYAILDLQINYYGWGKDQVKQYLEQYYSIEGTDVVDSVFYALVENPTNYLEYYVGYLEIINMKADAEKTLKDKFDLKEFNTFLLELGPAPFSVIQRYFKTWLLSEHL